MADDCVCFVQPVLKGMYALFHESNDFFLIFSDVFFKGADCSAFVTVRFKDPEACDLILVAMVVMMMLVVVIVIMVMVVIVVMPAAAAVFLIVVMIATNNARVRAVLGALRDRLRRRPGDGPTLSAGAANGGGTHGHRG